MERESAFAFLVISLKKFLYEGWTQRSTQHSDECLNSLDEELRRDSGQLRYFHKVIKLISSESTSWSQVSEMCFNAILKLHASGSSQRQSSMQQGFMQYLNLQRQWSCPIKFQNRGDCITRLQHINVPNILMFAARKINKGKEHDKDALMSYSNFVPKFYYKYFHTYKKLEDFYNDYPHAHPFTNFCC